MKNLSKATAFLGLMFIISVISCKKDSTGSPDNHFNEPFQIKVGEDISVSPLSNSTQSDSSVTVKFQKVIVDGRCIMSNCYLCYGSSADIQVKLVTPETELDLSLRILGCQEEYECNDNLYYKVDTLGYRICFLRLDPYPVEDISIDPSNYTAKINISKH